MATIMLDLPFNVIDVYFCFAAESDIPGIPENVSPVISRCGRSLPSRSVPCSAPRGTLSNTHKLSPKTSSLPTATSILATIKEEEY